jgi:NAD(P)-dependent dehydrogenase (short-subunit alcohol dehydrogenase family)
MLWTCLVTGAGALIVSLLRRPQYDFQPAHSPTESAVLITGGSRGIGHATAEYLSARGYTIFITVRKMPQSDESGSSNGKIIPILLDVTNDDHVGPAVLTVTDTLNKSKSSLKLVAIVNNAGINPEGDEITRNKKAGKPNDNQLSDPSVAERVFATNVLGVVRVTKAFLPLLSNGGRIVHIGSYFGSISGKAGLNHLYYESSKFALEGLSDGMRRSLKAEGISVSLIKPGNIQTEMNQEFGEVGPEVVAKDIYHAIASPSPLPRYYPGLVTGYNCHLLCWIFGVLPTWLTDKL